ncbi:hypothetical protein BJ978_001301 [Agromyces terreus]|uniref:Uncharacterized protein n=1 Tax=Agromyces terreus TaxID=424795 RepID=A0A9X2H105_9MICO|nr:hypothetical protein [Agromyces terreus]MCP2370625.1 hypothetical protein [Agromyces terreus]
MNPPARGPAPADPGPVGGPPRRVPLLARPRVRRILSRVVAAVGVVFAAVGLFTGRYGYLVVGIVVIGLGAALGPGRIRR